MCLELSSAHLRNVHKWTVHPNVAFPNGKNCKFLLKLSFGDTGVRNWESPTIYNFLTPMRIHKVKCNIENSTNACRWFPTERKILRLGSLYYTYIYTSYKAHPMLTLQLTELFYVQDTVNILAVCFSYTQVTRTDWTHHIILCHKALRNYFLLTQTNKG